MKIAAAYIHAIPGDITANLNQTLTLLQQLDKEGIGFVLFPELSITGYATAKQDIALALLQEEAVLQQLTGFSKSSNLSFAVGYPQQHNEQFFIAHYLFTKGKIAGIHQKSHLGPNEKSTFSEGDELSVFQTGPLKIGMQLCFETHFPEISYAQARQGANLLAMAFASPNETATEKSERFKRYLCARAYDNACYVMACNLSGSTARGAHLPGLAMIIDPKGNILAETQKTGSGYCVADFSTEKLNRIFQSKMAWFNHFKRDQFLNDACKKNPNTALCLSSKWSFTRVNSYFSDFASLVFEHFLSSTQNRELFLQDQNKFYD
ncbi:nitrilase-related carbon-nitrogen hydrolase [Geofilum sp. OHC36d9]|uniref:nitrilase-related carbon-nitrogen hydrolase n=1 Tax=Geofilum sp. OHC36d9 TaxID=3458413 RepID=UPI0040345B4C